MIIIAVAGTVLAIFVACLALGAYSAKPGTGSRLVCVYRYLSTLQGFKQSCAKPRCLQQDEPKKFKALDY